MSKRIKLGVKENPLNTAKSKKGWRAQELKEKIFPVLEFIEKHNINIDEVNTYSDIIEHFKKDFPFPNATEERNFELMGVDVSGIATSAKYLKEFKNDFYLEDGSVIVKQEWLDNIEDKYTYHTRTDADVKAFEYATKLAEVMGEGIKQGFISENMRNRIFHEIDLFYLEKDGGHNIRARGIYEAGERYEKYLKENETIKA